MLLQIGTCLIKMTRQLGIQDDWVHGMTGYSNSRDKIANAPYYALAFCTTAGYNRMTGYQNGRDMMVTNVAMFWHLFDSIQQDKWAHWMTSYQHGRDVTVTNVVMFWYLFSIQMAQQMGTSVYIWV